MVIYCDIIEVHNNFLPKHVGEILEFVINELEINPKKLTVLTDREFKNFEIIKIFERYGCKYICFVPKNDRIKYYLEKEYKKGKKWKFNYVMDSKTISKLVTMEEKLIINGKKKTVYYTFLTNADFKKPKEYLKTYEKRWSIETRFRMFKNVVIKTKSKISEVRLFLFMLRTIIHNLWAVMQYKNKTSNLKEFVIKINELTRMFIYSNESISNTQLCISNTYSEILIFYFFK